MLTKKIRPKKSLELCKTLILYHQAFQFFFLKWQSILGTYMSPLANIWFSPEILSLSQHCLVIVRLTTFFNFLQIWQTKAFLWSFMVSSTYNLLTITVERYMAVVVPIWYKTSFKNPRLEICSLAAPYIVGVGFTLGLCTGTRRTFRLNRSKRAAIASDTVSLVPLTL